MQIFIETERLIIREIVEADAPALFNIDSNEEVNLYLGRKPVTDISQTKNIIEFIRQQYVDNGIGRWAMVEKSTNTFIGWTGLKLITELTNNTINYHDLGYRINKNYWGKGYATESALACVNYGFTNLNLNKIIAIAHYQNKASHNVILKSGLHFKETFTYMDEVHNWYEISTAQKNKI
jgi:[ribosomal protein S5]-alanine N-acetyltransferase